MGAVSRHGEGSDGTVQRLSSQKTSKKLAKSVIRNGRKSVLPNVRHKPSGANAMNTTASFDPATHNGVFTATNPATGQHRTFRLKTQKPSARFAPNERILSLLTGPDNTSNYTSIGILKPNGRVVVWRKYHGTQFENLARMVERYTYWRDRRGFTFDWSATCRRCNRQLTTPESVASGIGPICSGR